MREDENVGKQECYETSGTRYGTGSTRGEMQLQAYCGLRSGCPQLTPHIDLPTQQSPVMPHEKRVIFDLSHRLEPDMQIYPGDPVFSCCSAANIKEHGYNVKQLSLGTHTGTHIDAPYHFVEHGKKVDELDISILVGRATVLDLTSKSSRERISWEDLQSLGVESLVTDRRIVIIHTGWSKYWKTGEYLNHPFIDAQAARKLLELGVLLLAIDTLSPDETVPDGQEGDFGVHDAILGSGGMIVENLTGLDKLPKDKDIRVSFLPLKLGDCDGSPIRAVAWAE